MPELDSVLRLPPQSIWILDIVRAYFRPDDRQGLYMMVSRQAPLLYTYCTSTISIYIFSANGIHSREHMYFGDWIIISRSAIRMIHLRSYIHILQTCNRSLLWMLNTYLSDYTRYTRAHVIRIERTATMYVCISWNSNGEPITRYSITLLLLPINMRFRLLCDSPRFARAGMDG